MSSRGFDLLGATNVSICSGAGRSVVSVSRSAEIRWFFRCSAVVDGDVVFRTDPGTKLIAAVLE